ncbi:MAG: hypothetical protein ACI9YO_001236 [Gammaproteobacteria bacterium]|jgi:hypothetical protein
MLEGGYLDRSDAVGVDVKMDVNNMVRTED